MYYHASTGLYLTHYRFYDPQSGRWLNRDPIGERGGINIYAYVNGKTLNHNDSLGLSGVLGIHSSTSGKGPSSLFGLADGHSWITYSQDGLRNDSFSTWGYPAPGEDTLQVNHAGEPDRATTDSDASSRYQYCDDSCEARLLDELNKLRGQGDSAWKLLFPCSSSAASMWNGATGESLSPGIPSNPSSLKDSIDGANKSDRSNLLPK